MSLQVKSKQRVIEHGEVFTAEREVKAMCDLVADECLKIDSRFLEPACGEGNFLLEILSRKLKTLKKPCQAFSEYERNSILALSSLYGIDILPDNVKICREKLFDLWNDENFSDEVKNSAKKILELNIICGDTLEYKDSSGNPIIFSEWSFPNNDSKILRRDFYFQVLTQSIIAPVEEYELVDYWRISDVWNSK